MRITDKERLEWVFRWVQELTVMEILELNRQKIDSAIRIEAKWKKVR